MAKKETSVTEPIAIPYGVSLEGLLDVIGAWNRAQGYARPLKADEVAERIRSSAKTESKAKLVSNQSTFLIQIGILAREGQSNRLTQEGREVARAVDFSRLDEFNSLMKKLILKWPQIQPLIEFTRYKGNVPREKLVERAVKDAKKSMGTTNAAMGGNTLVQLLEQVGILVAKGDSISLAKAIRHVGETLTLPKKSASDEQPAQTSRYDKELSSGGIAIQVTVLVAPSDDQNLERLREVISKLEETLTALGFKPS